METMDENRGCDFCSRLLERCAMRFHYVIPSVLGGETRYASGALSKRHWLKISRLQSSSIVERPERRDGRDRRLSGRRTSFCRHVAQASSCCFGDVDRAWDCRLSCGRAKKGAVLEWCSICSLPL